MDKPNGLLPGVECIPLNKRGLTQATVKDYGYGVVNGQQVAPYYDKKGHLVAQKVRTKDKSFYWLGDSSKASLFGMNTLSGSRMVVVTEGEIDAMSIRQALGGNWPAVSVPNGAQSAHEAVKSCLDELSSFDKVVLCYDNDDPGREALEKTVALFPPGKVWTVNLGQYKDANEMLVDGKADELRAAVFGAQAWRPDGVVDLYDCREAIAATPQMGRLYPWDGLNQMLFGYRPKELITWTAGTGTGKTALVSEVCYSLVMGGTKTGIVYLEEGVDKSGRRLVGLHLNKPLHLPGYECPNEEFDQAFEEVFGGQRLFAYDHFGSLDEDVLANRIRYMVKALGCEVIILDHVSMVVSGAGLDKDERRMLDYIMTTLRSLSQETGATIHVVSHLRRVDGKPAEEGGQISLAHLRGTQAIAQLSDAVIAAERNQQGEDCHLTQLRVLKNRYVGITGVACTLKYNTDTGRLMEVRPEEEQDGDQDY
jgi:twinkle protein